MERKAAANAPGGGFIGWQGESGSHNAPCKRMAFDVFEQKSLFFGPVYERLLTLFPSFYKIVSVCENAGCRLPATAAAGWTAAGRSEGWALQTNQEKKDFQSNRRASEWASRFQNLAEVRSPTPHSFKRSSRFCCLTGTGASSCPAPPASEARRIPR